MKYNRFILYAFGLLLATSSCDSFLDDQPRGNAIAETTDNYNGMFNTIQFMNLNIGNYTAYLNDDWIMDESCVESLPTTIGFVSTIKVTSAMRAFRYERDIYEADENCTAWEQCYKNIYTFNVIANGVMGSSGGTDAQKKALRAEARISRAWMHFILAQIFSKPYNAAYADTELTIPIVEEANSTQKSFQRATMRELYDFITREMEESCPELEDRTEHNMRVYMTTGYALLGKYYWMIGEYEKAIAPLKKAYERSLSDDIVQLTNFDRLQAKYDYRELTIDELNNEEGYSYGDFLLPATFADREVMWVKQSVSMGLFYYTYYEAPSYYLKPESYALFDDYDLRRNLIPTHDAYGEPLTYPLGCVRDSRTNYGVELPEVYLALAECEARAGSESNARKVLEEFRSYRMREGHAGIPPEVQSKEQLIRFCLDEQHREFMGRLQRYYNLRRLWNDPIFQSEKPITHSDHLGTYTLNEDNLYLELPEGVLKWNEEWR